STDGWVSGQTLTLHWQTPADVTGIKAAYIKAGAAPTNTDDFDVRYEVSAQAGVEDSVSFSVAQEGVVPVYLWFEDRAGNADIGKAASLTVNVDSTAPTKPVAIFPNAWSREDTVRFAWRKASDTGAGIKNYSITVEPQIFKGVVNPVEIDPDHLETTLVLNLDGRVSKFFRWYVAATDSADNQASSDTLSFALDATLPLIIHAPPDTIPVSQSLALSANVTDRLSGIASVEVWYRTAGQLTRQEQALTKISGDDYAITIPGTAIRSEGFEYVLIAADSAGNRRFLQADSSLSIFRSVVVQSSDLIAPSATRENSYQMVSMPYSIPEFALQPFFENNFGTYDDKQWRLLRWQEPVGYLELLAEDIEPLRPGRAFWLITRNSQAWKTGRAYSVSTAQKYEIPLNPGWNMISTPFAFDTDWRTVQLPVGVQSVLWEYSGSGYRMEESTLKSWHGYFIQNTGPNVQILQIAPVAANPTVQKTASLWEDMDWVLQLKGEYQGLQDAANFIGVAANANEGFDESEISEPPGIGKTPRLFFEHDNWLSSTNDFATDFRNENAGELAWQFVVENLSPGELRLSMAEAKAWPDSLAGILYDETTATKRAFSPGETAAIHIEPGETHRRFTLKLIPREQVESEISLPQDITLHAAWPNPYKRNSGKNVVFRFALNESSAVELRIYNVLGQEIYRATPASNLPQGEHALTWNARSRFGAPVATGLYFVSLIVNQKQRMQQKILVVE
ncbi:MAG: T9SS type A sorting domain-containing protein, partial [bacterium]